MSKTPSILDNYPHYEVTIGIEVHVQLLTNTKIFCTCANQTGQEPNTNICQICAGYPGVLPVLNKKVVENALKAGFATNCSITKNSWFARKHYFYPDLPKNYQITQSDAPICTEGFIPITLEDGSTKNIRLIRIHIEEDAGKNVHVSGSNESFVDLNRAGTPLLEIVSHPDISSTYQAKTYLKTLHQIVKYLGICSGNMEEGAFRADTNISVRKKGATQFGIRCELKNINSFKFIGDAVEYEIERQIELLESGQSVKQETRLWDTKNKKTIVMRSKEHAADYRYFQDPDLPMIHIDDAWLETVKANMPELPAQKMERLIKQQGLTEYEADIIIDDMELAHYYEQARTYTSSKQLINWILRDVLGYIKEAKTTLPLFAVTPKKLSAIIDMLEKGTINNPTAKEVFLLVAQTGGEPEVIVKERGLQQMGSSQELEAIIDQLLKQNAQEVARYKAGEVKLFGFFVGQAMQLTKGKANPKMLQEILKQKLNL